MQCAQLAFPAVPCTHPAGQPLQLSWRCELASWKKPAPQFPQTTLAVVEHAPVRCWPPPQEPQLLHALWPESPCQVEPALHCVQLVAPVDAWTHPLGQLLHEPCRWEELSW